VGRRLAVVRRVKEESDTAGNKGGKLESDEELTSASIIGDEGNYYPLDRCAC